MNIRIHTLIEGETAAYAEAELLRCLSAMDGGLTEGEGGLALTLAPVDGDPERDTVRIDVRDGVGTIGGTNPCALLIAVYRFLYELGCRWTHPGEGGEHIPHRPLDGITVRVEETPSRRHRGVCIEGAVSEENVLEMIEFLPRVGMNSYFIQFFRPTVFFERWYGHWGNPTAKGRSLPSEEIDAMHARLSAEIARRGLRHHAVGHGWTCAPYGVPAEGWHQFDDDEMPKALLDDLAEVGGKRTLTGRVPLNTNLCYSRPEVRSRMADAVVEYCLGHPTVSVLHLWLADGTNNNCECPGCRDTRPSDFYVMLLNEVDEKLTARGLATKIVFLIYVDLLWAPEREAIRNPDRFLIMFAPITRTYSKTLREGAQNADAATLRPYERNRLVFPRDVAENVAYLGEWRRMFTGSGFLFDYHLMWDHARDLGYMDISRTLFTDMKELDVLGLDGMISCQLSRSAFPTGLPLYGMARALWDKDADFDRVADEYFIAEFGERGAAVRSYLEEMSRRIDPRLIRKEKPLDDPECLAALATVPALVDGFLAANPDVTEEAADESLRTLAIHAEVARRLSAIALRRGRGEDTTAEIEALRAYLGPREPLVQHRVDLWNFFANLVPRNFT